MAKTKNEAINEVLKQSTILIRGKNGEQAFASIFDYSDTTKDYAAFEFLRGSLGETKSIAGHITQGPPPVQHIGLHEAGDMLANPTEMNGIPFVWTAEDWPKLEEVERRLAQPRQDAIANSPTQEVDDAGNPVGPVHSGQPVRGAASELTRDQKKADRQGNADGRVSQAEADAFEESTGRKVDVTE